MENAIDAEMNEIRILITNSISHDVINQKLSEFGYTTEKLQEGQAIFNETEGFITMQKEEYNEQFEASDNFYFEWKLAKKISMRTLKFARIAFEDNTKILNDMHANKSRSNRYDVWRVDARAMYDTLLGDESLINVMLEFGYSIEKLTAEYEVVKNLDTLHNTFMAEKGEAQNSTLIRDQKLQELLVWKGRLVKVARLALADQPQLLEILGIIVKRK